MASTPDFSVNSLFSVKDHICLVTGGGTGIGLMATQALSANGAKVYITGRRTSVLENTSKTHDPKSHDAPVHGDIIPIGSTDVTSKDDLLNLAKEIEAKEGYLSLVVAAAGINGPKEPFPETTSAQKFREESWNAESMAEWSETWTSDVTSVYFTTLAMLPLLQAAPRGHTASVIVISSMSGIMRDAQGHLAYNAAKAGTVHLSKMMSKEFAKFGVRVNSIAPGYFPSEMTTSESDERNKSSMPDSKVQDKGHEVPAGRAGEELEMGMSVLYLAKCGYVNGQIVAVDGGVLNEVGA